MADDIGIDQSVSPGAAKAATHEVDGRHYQLVKLVLGGPGVAELVTLAGLPVTAAALPLPAGAASEETAAAIRAAAEAQQATLTALQEIAAGQAQTLAAIQTLADSMLYFTSAILEKMPRVNGSDAAAVIPEGGTVSNITTVATVSSLSQLAGRTSVLIPEATAQMGASHLYSNIKVS
jgi:hypothetical protein